MLILRLSTLLQLTATLLVITQVTALPFPPPTRVAKAEEIVEEGISGISRWIENGRKEDGNDGDDFLVRHARHLRFLRPPFPSFSSSSSEEAEEAAASLSTHQPPQREPGSGSPEVSTIVFFPPIIVSIPFEC